jgi:hypothetical protein
MMSGLARPTKYQDVGRSFAEYFILTSVAESLIKLGKFNFVSTGPIQMLGCFTESANGNP